MSYFICRKYMETLETKGFKALEGIKAVEDSIISDADIKPIMESAGEQLVKVFGEEGRYNRYKKDHGDDVFQKTLDKDHTFRIDRAKAMTDSKGKTMVIKNSLLMNYLIEKGYVAEKEVDKIREVFKADNGDVKTFFRENGINEEIVNELEKYLGHLNNNKEILINNREEILQGFHRPGSLESVLGHELTHYLFKHFARIGDKKSKYRDIEEALNEGYAFGIQKALHLFDKTEITPDEIRQEIRKLYKTILKTKNSYNEKQYAFMKSFIVMMGGMAIANAVGSMGGDKTNQKLFDASYNKTTYTAIFSLYDEMVHTIKDQEIRKELEEMKKVSLHQLSKCKNILERELATQYNDYENNKDKHKRAKEFVRTLELLDLTGEEKSKIFSIKREYFTKYIRDMGEIHYSDIRRKQAIETLKSALFSPQQMIEAIEELSW